jgi:response regulator RpfG family c-di-GMP phosphodiesterase
MSAQKKHCLLVVDDEPFISQSVRDLLRREFEVVEAHSADEGARILQEREVHIVMTDQRMPKVTGVELLHKVKNHHPRCVRMLFTGYADVEAIIAAINDGRIFHFLRKPWQPEELERAAHAAAAEYDRLVEQEERDLHTSREIEELRNRVNVLEEEVARLRAAAR